MSYLCISILVLIFKGTLFSIIILSVSNLFAQDLTYSHKQFKIASKASIILNEVEDWNIRVMSLEMPFPGDGSYRGFLMEQKKSITPRLKYIRENDTLSNVRTAIVNIGLDSQLSSSIFLDTIKIAFSFSDLNDCTPLPKAVKDIVLTPAIASS